MKRTILSALAFMLSLCGAYASDIISRTPADGIGKQIVSIHSSSGSAKNSESAFNLLYNGAEGPESIKKWCNNSALYPWVVFELNDIYTIDRILFRDVKPYETGPANVPEYTIYVSTEHPDNCMWTEVVHKKRQYGIDIKDYLFEKKQEARYVKFQTARGERLDGTKDDAIRIYGLDIYGEYSSPIDREDVISTGKKVIGFSDAGSYYERPLNLIDGNLTNAENLWRCSKPSSSDSLAWVIIDLEQEYWVEKFRLHDAQTLTKSNNIKGYSAYLSQTAPDLGLIGKGIDKNTCWMKVVDAYALDRTEVDIKEDEIQSMRARYVKLEVPRSCAGSMIRLFQFEILGEKAATSVEMINEERNFTLSPSIITSGESFYTEGEAGLLKIFNLHGQAIYQQAVGEEKTSVVAPNLNAGVYIVRVENDIRTRSAKLIVR